MTESYKCPDCGMEIPPDSPANLCPNCLLREGLKNSAGVKSDPRVISPSPHGSSRGFVPPSPEELTQRFPQLEILELLGKGGMGAVYKGRHRGLDRLVAVKILPPEISGQPGFSERFTREARALARLNHPGIVTVYDSGQVDGLYYFVMEFIDGVNLRQAIRTGKLTADEALTIVPQICDALQFAHNEGIIHRDIKPENILLDKRGRVKIADFGVAKLLGQDPEETMLTGAHDLMGTLRYMAPEQMAVSRDVDHRADIYSLGVVFYELLTGELPIGRFAPPSKKVQIDVRIDEVVLRALEQEPDQRYQHASEVKTDVEKLGQKHPLPPKSAVDASPYHYSADGNQVGVAPDDSASNQSASKLSDLQIQFSIAIQTVRFPAIGLIIAGGIDCFLLVMMFAGTGIREVLFLLLIAVLGLIKILGGINLLSLKSQIFAQFAAILAIFPISPSALIGLPSGIWALIVLNRSNVKSAFVENQLKPVPKRAELKSVGKVPPYDWRKAYILFLLGWVFAGAMWNFGYLGLFLATAVMGGIFTFLCYWKGRNNPELLHNWSQFSPIFKSVNLGACVLFAMLGCYLLLTAFETSWENSLAWERHHAFAASHKGREYILIRQLAAFKDVVPTVELWQRGFSWSMGWRLGGSSGPHKGVFGWYSVSMSIIVGLMMLAQAFPILFSPNAWRLNASLKSMNLNWTATRCSLPVVAMALVTGLFTFVVLSMFYVFSELAVQNAINRPRMSVKLDSEGTLAAFEKWSNRNGYATGDSSIYNIDTVPKGEKLGEVRQTMAWKPSQFDRWHMTWHGMERTTPHLMLTTISSDAPVETIVNIEFGWYPTNPKIRLDWESLLDDLKREIEQAAIMEGPEPSDGLPK